MERSWSLSERLGGWKHSTSGSRSGRVLTFKVSVWFANAALISSIWRADAVLPLRDKISSPDFKPVGLVKNIKKENLLNSDLTV